MQQYVKQKHNFQDLPKLTGHVIYIIHYPTKDIVIIATQVQKGKEVLSGHKDQEERLSNNVFYPLARVTSISTAEVQTGKNSEQGGESHKIEGRMCTESCERQGGVHLF